MNRVERFDDFISREEGVCGPKRQMARRSLMWAECLVTARLSGKSDMASLNVTALLLFSIRCCVMGMASFCTSGDL